MNSRSLPLVTPKTRLMIYVDRGCAPFLGSINTSDKPTEAYTDINQSVLSLIRSLRGADGRDLCSCPNGSRGADLPAAESRTCGTLRQRRPSPFDARSPRMIGSSVPRIAFTTRIRLFGLFVPGVSSRITLTPTVVSVDKTPSADTKSRSPGGLSRGRSMLWRPSQDERLRAAPM